MLRNSGGPEAFTLPPKLDDLERRLTLARLVAAWAKLQPNSLVVGGPASTCRWPAIWRG